MDVSTTRNEPSRMLRSERNGRRLRARVLGLAGADDREAQRRVTHVDSVPGVRGDHQDRSRAVLRATDDRVTGEHHYHFALRVAVRGDVEAGGHLTDVDVRIV